MGVFVVRISGEIFSQILTEGEVFGGGRIVRCVKGIPAGSRLIGISMHLYFDRNLIALKFEHESIRETPPFQTLPILDVEYDEITRTGWFIPGEARGDTIEELEQYMTQQAAHRVHQQMKAMNEEIEHKIVHGDPDVAKPLGLFGGAEACVARAMEAERQESEAITRAKDEAVKIPEHAFKPLELFAKPLVGIKSYWLPEAASEPIAEVAKTREPVAKAEGPSPLIKADDIIKMMNRIAKNRTFPSEAKELKFDKIAGEPVRDAEGKPTTLLDRPMVYSNVGTYVKPDDPQGITKIPPQHRTFASMNEYVKAVMESEKTGVSDPRLNPSRTKSQVLADRKSPAGCCLAYRTYQPCQCLEGALEG